MLLIPYSNAELESIFSRLKKKKTLECSSWKQDGVFWH